MSVRQRQPIQSNVENEEQQQPTQSQIQNEEAPHQEQNLLKKRILDILHWLLKEIYGSISSSFRYAGQFLYHTGLKPVFQAFLVVALMLGIIYAAWKYIIYAVSKYILKMFVLSVVCQTFVGSFPVVSNYCDNSTMIVLPVDLVVEKTVEIAELLSEADVSAPIKVVEVKISLIDLQTSVLYSQIEQPTKNQLIEQIKDMRSSATLTTDQLYKMLASFKGALSKLEIYSNNLFHILTKKAGTNEIQLQFKSYLEDVEREIERVIFNAVEAYSKLVNLQEEVDVLNEIASKSHEIDEKKLDAIERANFLSKFYHATIGNGTVDKAKYERNIRVFNQFTKFTESAAIKIENVISKLQEFRNELDEMKYISSELGVARTLQLNSHLEILRNALESLHKYKKQFIGRIAENNTT